ncbi:hypothetical protein PRIPAC_93316 [Pristionchus pacificus]|uniref:Uncharacterized protein n=1 Tax=Pristionchus pacificus TaxID=54126 RepID=A0A2A6BJ10_PRIPA|nr:hypothetical protein PRIPAC_93316 [Pristionchus pacificus]|eukprot:PDM65879.1 hypothetical protein PRIPAC_44158 [Pristionchus pacificus]
MTLCLQPNNSYLSYSFGSLQIIPHNDNPSRRPSFGLPIIDLPFHIPRHISHSLPISISHRTSSIPTPRSPSPIISDHSSLHYIIEASLLHKGQITTVHAVKEGVNSTRSSFSAPSNILRKVAHWIVTSNFDEKPTSF